MVMPVRKRIRPMTGKLMLRVTGVSVGMRMPFKVLTINCKAVTTGPSSVRIDVTPVRTEPSEVSICAPGSSCLPKAVQLTGGGLQLAAGSDLLLTDDDEVVAERCRIECHRSPRNRG